MKAIAKAPVTQVVKLSNPKKFNALAEGCLQLAEDLDYIQTLISAVLREPSLNPALNALHDAFIRRRITKRFKAAGRGVELDMLLHGATRGVRDYKEGNNKESH